MNIATKVQTTAGICRIFRSTLSLLSQDCMAATVAFSVSWVFLFRLSTARYVTSRSQLVQFAPGKHVFICLSLHCYGQPVGLPASRHGNSATPSGERRGVGEKKHTLAELCRRWKQIYRGVRKTRNAADPKSWWDAGRHHPGSAAVSEGQSAAIRAAPESSRAQHSFHRSRHRCYVRFKGHSVGSKVALSVLSQLESPGQLETMTNMLEEPTIIFLGHYDNYYQLMCKKSSVGTMFVYMRTPLYKDHFVLLYNCKETSF